MKKIILFLFLITNVLSGALAAQKGFVIIIDNKSLQEAKTEVDAYAKAIEKVNKLKVYTVIDRWGVPDSIRACLQTMNKKQNVCGVVFIGDIPVAMVRDAQHLTSAFKMDQRLPRKDSSVPSDRYYDDFGLKFNYIGKDDSTQLFYYSLRADGDQKIKCDLFSGRICPTDAGGTSRYEKLRKYLRKAVAEKLSGNRLDEVFFFTGQGSIDESRVAAMDEKIQYYEHFPWLRNAGAESVKYMDYSEDTYIKFKLMEELMRNDLDLSILHHHGDFDTQYLSKENKKVPDSVDEKNRDLHLSDFEEYNFNPSSRIVIFDACYNAAFINPDCIANEYIFRDGKTVACMGGTVNLLQDKWYDRFIGLLGFGHTIGEINSWQEFLESHIIGDPTFTFAPEKEYKENETSDGVALRLTLDFEKGKVSTDKLLDVLKNSKYDQVRLQALELLAEKNDANFAKGIHIASFDRYEMTQRFAANYMRDNGSPELAKDVVRLNVTGSTSARVKTDAHQAIEFFPKNVLLNAFNEVWPKTNVVFRDSLENKYRSYLSRHGNYWDKEVDELIADTLKEKTFRFNASCMRLYCPHSRVPDILRFIETNDNDAHRIQLMEAMGWYKYSYQRDKIAAVAKRMSEDSSLSAKLREEALKTYNRVKR